MPRSHEYLAAFEAQAVAEQEAEAYSLSRSGKPYPGVFFKTAFDRAYRKAMRTLQEESDV